MNAIETKRRELQVQIDELLAKPKLTASEEKKCDLLMSQAADLRAQEARQARLETVLEETRAEREANSPEHRAAKHLGDFRRYLLGQGPSASLAVVNGRQVRTYFPLSIPGVPMPEQFLAEYREALKSFSGIREAGASIVTTTTGDNLKNPFSTDANVGERLNESDLASLANPTLSKTEFVAYNYGSKGVQYSVQLFQDSGVDVIAYLRNIFAKRIGRITNTEFTNGASGGPVGVLPSITNIATSAAATTVSVAEVVGLQSLDAGYLDNNAGYMFSPGVERQLKAMVTTGGLPVFPEMRTGRVLAGYKYTLNVDMPSSLTANAKSIAFGNFERGVVIREVVPTLLVSKEAFAEYRLMYSVMFHRQDCQTVDANALSVLQQAAS